MMEYS